MMAAMAYYYFIPCYLTAVFLTSYGVVRLMLSVFDALNFFWDWWDRQRRAFPVMVILEWIILLGFVYYIVYWELSGAADPQSSPDFLHRILGWFTSPPAPPVLSE